MERPHDPEREADMTTHLDQSLISNKIKKVQVIETVKRREESTPTGFKGRKRSTRREVTALNSW